MAVMALEPIIARVAAGAAARGAAGSAAEGAGGSALSKFGPSALQAGIAHHQGAQQGQQQGRRPMRDILGEASAEYNALLQPGQFH